MLVLNLVKLLIDITYTNMFFVILNNSPEFKEVPRAKGMSTMSEDAP